MSAMAASNASRRSAGTCIRVAEWKTTTGAPRGTSAMTRGSTPITSPLTVRGGSCATTSSAASSRAAWASFSGQTSARSQSRSSGSVASIGCRSTPTRSAMAGTGSRPGGADPSFHADDTTTGEDALPQVRPANSYR